MLLLELMGQLQEIKYFWVKFSVHIYLQLRQM